MFYDTGCAHREIKVLVSDTCFMIQGVHTEINKVLVSDTCFMIQGVHTEK